MTKTSQVINNDTTSTNIKQASPELKNIQQMETFPRRGENPFFASGDTSRAARWPRRRPTLLTFKGTNVMTVEPDVLILL